MFFLRISKEPHPGTRMIDILYLYKIYVVGGQGFLSQCSGRDPSVCLLRKNAPQFDYPLTHLSARGSSRRHPNRLQVIHKHTVTQKEELLDEFNHEFNRPGEEDDFSLRSLNGVP